MSDDDWDDDDCALGQQKAQAALQDYLTSKPKSRTNYAALNGVSGNGGGTRLIFHIGRNDVGRLIGRAGATIKGLRQDTGCKVYSISIS